MKHLTTLFPRALPSVSALIASSHDLFKEYGLDNDRRFRMFLAQMAHESAEFRFLEERAYRNTSFEEKYGRHTRVGKILGNTELWDGDKYKGRGIIQLTGKWNYGYYGTIIGVDLIKQPKLASKPDIALKLALAYWRSKRLNEAADLGDVKATTFRINGGSNGLKARQSLYDALKGIRYSDYVKIK